MYFERMGEWWLLMVSWVIERKGKDIEYQTAAVDMRQNGLQDKSIEKAYSRYARYSTPIAVRFGRNYAPNPGPMMIQDPQEQKRT